MKKNVPEPGGWFRHVRHMQTHAFAGQSVRPYALPWFAPILRSDHAGNSASKLTELYPAQRRSFAWQEWEDARLRTGSLITISAAKIRPRKRNKSLRD